MSLQMAQSVNLWKRMIMISSQFVAFRFLSTLAKIMYAMVHIGKQ